MTTYIIEGLDRLGKSTLIEGILNTVGYHQVIHFGKPKVLDIYKQTCEMYDEHTVTPQFMYQMASFQTMFELIRAGATIIFDRGHLGEAVYGPMYRDTPPNYVFSLEDEYQVDEENVSLILLTEDFSISKHFESDGESFDDSKREEEQKLFIEAFNKSIIKNKRIICVTDPTTGEFRSKLDIIVDALK